MALRKGFVKFIGGVALAGALFYGYHYAVNNGYIKTPGFMAAVVPSKATLPDVKEAKVENVAPAPIPTDSTLASIDAPQIRGAIWEWNAQMGLLYATGGAQTAKGSLMEKHGVNLLLYRQDDTGKMQEDLIACAEEIHNGAKQCSKGANFVIIMGDGAGQFIAAVNPQLQKLNTKLVTIGSVGYSRGEDAFMAPPEVKADAQKARGLLVAGVLRDGDWNIAMKYASENNIKNNPSETTYDPDALNWVNSKDYNTAAQDYIAGKCEERKVVKDGKPTSESRRVCVNAVVTWTPGDVAVVQKKGGLVKVVSTKEYRSQMPAVIIGSKAFFDANRAQVQGMLAAVFEGGDQVKAFDAALKRASEISAKVYDDYDAAYWYKYYKGVVETDAQGNKVSLGGSTVNNLGDNLILFGLMPGANDNFRATYTTFANIVTQQYPTLFEKTPIPDVRDAVDKSFITGAQAVVADSGAEADTPKYNDAAPAEVVSSRSYAITFDTGKATLTPEGVRLLSEIKDNIAITSLYIQIDGYTDNTGSDLKNKALSEARAAAVRNFLQTKAPANFPDTRFTRVVGHGAADPVASNATSEGRAANRRVKVSLLRGEN
jgi:outer membrane protein OmpA-like peptidoglycan-associated protein